MRWGALSGTFPTVGHNLYMDELSCRLAHGSRHAAQLSRAAQRIFGLRVPVRCRDAAERNGLQRWPLPSGVVLKGGDFYAPNGFLGLPCHPTECAGVPVRFDEEESLDVVTVALDGLPTIPGAEYEVVVPEDIPASRVIGIVDMDAFLSEPSLCHG